MSDATNNYRFITRWRLRASAEEVFAILEWGSLISNQAKPGFVHQRRGLKCLAGSFLGHFGSGEPPQFVVNEYKQLLGCF